MAEVLGMDGLEFFCICISGFSVFGCCIFLVHNILLLQAWLYPGWEQKHL
jgi:hypothetical protein